MIKFSVKTDSDKHRARAAQRQLMLYHVSPRANRESIQQTGIEPAVFAMGKQKTAWYVESSRVMWALVHCAGRHNVGVFELDVWIIERAQFKKLTATNMAGVYQSPCNVKVRVFMTAQKAEEKEREWIELLS